MGFSEKHQVVDGGLDLDGNKRWVIAGIPLRAPLKPIFTNPVEKETYDESDDATTPTSEEAKIPSKLVCPPAPRKRKATFKCNYTSGMREFFTPPDLETLFIQRAN
ncbi:cyclin-dependent protein kinase inhibitor SMR6-like [Populus alba x Populus x berolinensis]|uniref:Cyclin-dependent protein kinase inhibitor SMR6-like n=1 Tax=Populus alba x Populus x berolinensis TaxID=444605 RepID=A0AAD6MNR3_9ROSI|nr:cyclin-dependent protein kinase inhibitor SMR6-like [Populus alba x Populus x berolinensis]